MIPQLVMFYSPHHKSKDESQVFMRFAYYVTTIKSQASAPPPPYREG